MIQKILDSNDDIGVVMKILKYLLFVLWAMDAQANEYTYIDGSWNNLTINLNESLRYYTDTTTVIEECSHKLLDTCFIINDIYFAIPKSVANGDYSYTKIYITRDIMLMFLGIKESSNILGQEQSGYAINISNINEHTSNNNLIYNKEKGVLMFQTKEGTYLSEGNCGLFSDKKCLKFDVKK